MARLLFTAALAYVAYRIYGETIAARHVPPDERAALRKQSAALGVDPSR
jgi:hypothetical protein